MRNILMIVILCLLAINSSLYSFDFGGANKYIKQAENFGNKAKELKGRLNKLQDKYTNLTNGFGFDNFNLNGFNLGSNVECNLPAPSANFDVCDMIKKRTGFDFFGQLNRNFNIAGCKGKFNLGSGNGLSDAIKNMCNLGHTDVEIAWSPHDIDMNELLQSNSLKRNKKSTDVTEDGDKYKIKSTNYKGGLNTNTLYNIDKGVGAISHTAISDGISTDGIKVPIAMRSAYAKDNVAIYSAYERSVKDLGIKKAFKITKPTAPAKTYEQYIAKEQGSILSLSGSKPTRLAYQTNIEYEITRLKKKYDFANLKGSSSSEMRFDYSKKVQEMLRDLLQINSTTSKGSNANSKLKGADIHVYAKAIRDIKIYERRKFNLNRDNYIRSHHSIIQPSQGKIDIQPDSQKWKYADKMMMQYRNEVSREVAFKDKIDKIQYKLREEALEIFYDKLEYNPMIANKEIEELLQ